MVKNRAQKGKSWLGGCGEGRGEGEGAGLWHGREGFGTLNIYFCLCVSKEILAITGVFFLPGMKQK